METLHAFPKRRIRRPKSAWLISSGKTKMRMCKY